LNHFQSICFVLLCGALLVACSLRASNKTSEPLQSTQQTKSEGSILKDIPEKIDKDARWLFYLHGRIVEDQGTLRPISPRYGAYEYEDILKAFKGTGFIVVSEVRPKDTDAKKYAQKVVDQIKRLLDTGVKPQRITVVGASKGASIAMHVSTGLKNRGVGFVFLGARPSRCSDDVLKNSAFDFHGRVLSIYEASDDSQTCQEFFDRSSGLSKKKEIELKTGLGHGFIYRPLKEWVGPTIDWAKNGK
jgi:hypothetical protein